MAPASGQPVILPSSPPPPYTLPEHFNSPSVTDLHNDQIPLLPLPLSFSPSLSPNQPNHAMDVHSQRILKLALRDYQRQQTPSEWGKYRHGQPVIQLSSWTATGQEPPGLVIRSLIWLVGLMALPDDLASNAAWREGAGMLAGANHF
ncbi:hypothetical protein IAT40_000979 [Kwoniella sp. CBS 6097]